MGLFDSIRRVVGGGDDGAAESDEGTTQPGLVDTRDLDVAALRERATGVADEVDVLDFSLDSLSQFDDAIDAGYDEALATSDKPGTYATDTVRFGCYLGEVLVRAYDGEWTRNPEWGVTITGPDDTTTVAVFDVAERSITTGAVFAAVADRAAVEVGLDGDPAADAEPSVADAEPATGSPETPADDDDAPTDEADDPTAPVDGPATDAPGEAASTTDPSTDQSTDEEPAAGTPEPESAADTADPAAAEPTLTETDREAVDRIVDDADSLIEEAEPAADDAPADESAPLNESSTESDPSDPEPEPGDSPETADSSASLFADDTDPAARADHDTATDDPPSLFDDEATGAGPTVDDAPSAADGRPDSGSTGATDDDAAGVAPDAPPADASSADASSDDSDGSDAPADADGDGLRATYAEEAEEFVAFWTEYDLDYTPDSLERLDALVSEEWDDDRFDDAAFGSEESFDDRVFTSVSTELGSYFGEVLVRELDAEWSDETTTDGVVVQGADGPLAIPVFKVAGTSIKQQPVFARSYESLLSDLQR